MKGGLPENGITFGKNLSHQENLKDLLRVCTADTRQLRASIALQKEFPK